MTEALGRTSGGRSAHQRGGWWTTAFRGRAGALCLVATVAFAGCVSSANGDADDPSVELGDLEPERDETDRERRARIAKVKRARCQEIGSALQAAQRHDTIVNVNDTDSVRQMARQLASTADSVDEVDVDSKELVQLRELQTDYADTMRGMARALQQAAKSKGTAQKKALESFRGLEPTLPQTIDSLNDVCNAPVE